MAGFAKKNLSTAFQAGIKIDSPCGELPACYTRKTMKARHNQTVCEWAGVEPSLPKPHSKLGIALSTIGKRPINGLRHRETDNTNGWYIWYIWCGNELSQAEDFFSPLHIERIGEYLPEVIDFLELPAGSRFLIDGNN